MATVIVALVLALIGSGFIGAKAFIDGQRIEDGVEQIVAKEVEQAKTAQKAELEKQFAEKEKSPTKTFKGSATYGSVTFDYPKTWSGYVDQSGSSQPIDGFFFPDIVPAVSGGSSNSIAYALRVELIATDYAQVVKQFDSQITDGSVKAAAYVPPKMAAVAGVQTGTRFDGEIEQDITGSMVVVKVRDKTLKIYTQSNRYLADFNGIVLKSLTFAP